MNNLRNNNITFEKLFKESYEKLYYHALSFLNDSEASKDIVNDVFEYVWKNKNKFDYSYSLEPFLYKLVKNNCLNYIRHYEVKNKYRDFKLSNSNLFEEDYSEYEVLIERLIKAIDNLPTQSSNVFRKCFIEGKKYKEVGDELGVSVNTIKTHITKSLRLLRGEFKNEILLYFFSFSKKKIEKHHPFFVVKSVY